MLIESREQFTSTNLTPHEQGLLKIDFLHIKDPLKESWVQENFQLGHLNPDDLTPEILEPLFQTYLTAIHEIGHKKVVRNVNWLVSIISVIPNGNRRGYLSFVPSGLDSTKTFYHKLIAACLGSVAIQERFGINPYRGTGSDLPQALNAAQRLSRINGSSASGNFSYGLSLARACIAGTRHTDVKQEAMSLVKTGIAT